MIYAVNTLLKGERKKLFVVGKLYSKNNIYRILDVPPQRQGGNWDTGYTCYNNCYYLFVNIGVAGRTGHIHKNFWKDGDLFWVGKKGSHILQPTIKNLIVGQFKILIFSRNDSANPYFTYNGLGTAKEVIDESPVKICWTFTENETVYVNDEFPGQPQYAEGNTTTVCVNRYERNIKARRSCIDHYGCKCMVCGFDFQKVYGEIGREFIHVHHIKPLHEIGNNYIIDPVADLRPVCPNCHAMIHKRETPYSIEEMQLIIEKAKAGS